MGDCFLLPKIKKCTSRVVFVGGFSDFSEQLSNTSKRLLGRQKTVTTDFPDSLGSSHQDVPFDPKHLGKVPGNHPL